MPDPHPLHAYTDPETGIYVERCFYTEGTREIVGEDHFWFAYHPAHLDNPFEGAPGKSATEAIGRVLAKHPELRRAAA